MSQIFVIDDSSLSVILGENIAYPELKSGSLIVVDKIMIVDD